MHDESTADEAGLSMLLDAAELWLVAARTGAVPGDAVDLPRMIAGWEDAHEFCAAVCTTDVGLAFCRRCPQPLVSRAAMRGRPGSERCPAGVRLLAVPVGPSPDRSGEQIAVLRLAPPAPSDAAGASAAVRVAPAKLRQAAGRAAAARGITVRRAVRRLRDPVSRTAWQTGLREAAADHRRASAAALTQMAATADDLTALYRSARRERAELARSQRRVDRLAQEAVRAKDHERALIAHRIHDTAAQSMVSAFRFLDAARAAAAGTSLEPGVDRQLGEASDRLLNAIGEVRGVLAEVLPPGLDQLGVGPAVRSRVQYLLGEHGADGPIAGDVTGELPRLDGWVEQALYSIVGEAVANAVRHSGARRIEVVLREQRGRAVVIVDDDGRGIQPGDGRHADGRGLGILGMSRQTSWLGGRLAIGPRPGGGTRIRVSIPVERHRRPADEPVTTPPDPRAAGG